jgi:hypothetical protein
LKQEFINISNNLDANNKTFEKFVLNALIDELPENVFIDIKFETIHIIESNITRIHSNAFNSTSLITQYYIDWISVAKLRNSPPPYDIYEAFSSLVNLKELDIKLDVKSLHEIPDFAFSKSNHQQNHLKKISYDCPISRIGKYAFFNLPALRIIDFNWCSIQNISAHAFDFQFFSDSIVEINLSSSELDESCIENDAFQSSMRKIDLNLSIDSNYNFKIY